MTEWNGQRISEEDEQKYLEPSAGDRIVSYLFIIMLVIEIVMCLFFRSTIRWMNLGVIFVSVFISLGGYRMALNARVILNPDYARPRRGRGRRGLPSHKERTLENLTKYRRQGYLAPLALHIILLLLLAKGISNGMK